MKQEIITEFLAVPGVEGIAFIDGRSRPYFYGVAPSLNLLQKDALTLGIQQVIHTTPSDFQSFEVQFSDRQIYLYRLNRGLILLVVAYIELNHAQYAEAITHLTQALQNDTGQAIAALRQLGQPPSPPPPSTVPDRALEVDTLNLEAIAAPPVSLDHVVAAMNQLSRFTTQYLGTIVVVNYWKTTRPKVGWLDQFQIERSGQFMVVAHASTPAARLGRSSSHLTPEQQQWVQQWVSSYIQRCTKAIDHFPSLVRQHGLDESQQQLLLGVEPI